MPKKTSPTTALAKWDQRLADMAKAAKKAVAGIGGGGNFISLRGGNLAYQGQVIPGNRMKVIVADWVLENQAYEGGFSEDSPQSPFCYAFGRSKEEMVPNPENVPEPVNATCDGCPNNQWGSAETGRGKACAEVARLALVSEADFGDIEKAAEAYLKVPVTSMRYWGGYVRELEQVYHRPPLAFITEVSVVPQKELPGWHVEFKLVEPIEDEATFAPLMELHDKIAAKIMFPYPKFDEAAKAAPAKAVPTARRAPVRRAAAPAPPPAAARRGKVAAVPKF